jgi:protein of hypothetical function DUF891
MRFTVEFYEKKSGETPVRDFIDSMEPKMGAKVLSMLEILEKEGNRLRLPYSRFLGEGIFELRCKFGSDITRTLYFFYEGATIVLTNGFVKKTQRTPLKEIQLAKDRRKDYLERKGKAK